MDGQDCVPFKLYLRKQAEADLAHRYSFINSDSRESVFTSCCIHLDIYIRWRLRVSDPPPSHTSPHTYIHAHRTSSKHSWLNTCLSPLSLKCHLNNIKGIKRCKLRKMEVKTADKGCHVNKVSGRVKEMQSCP